MPVTFSMGPGANRCTIALSGLVTRADAEQTIVHLAATRTWNRQTIVDTTDAAGVLVQFADLEKLMGLLQGQWHAGASRGPVAVVAPNDIMYRIAELYAQAMAAVVPLRIRVVRTLEEADWALMTAG